MATFLAVRTRAPVATLGCTRITQPQPAVASARAATTAKRASPRPALRAPPTPHRAQAGGKRAFHAALVRSRRLSEARRALRAPLARHHSRWARQRARAAQLAATACTRVFLTKLGPRGKAALLDAGPIRRVAPVQTLAARAGYRITAQRARPYPSCAPRGSWATPMASPILSAQGNARLVHGAAKAPLNRTFASFREFRSHD